MLVLDTVIELALRAGEWLTHSKRHQRRWHARVTVSGYAAWAQKYNRKAVR